MKKRKNNIVKIIIVIMVLVLLLLLLFSKKIFNLNKYDLKLAENVDEDNSIQFEANVPELSAGMIPIKWNGSTWEITTKDDKQWYNYETNKPAYIMLSDGKYQSELLSDMTNKKLAAKNIGSYINTKEVGTIYVWIPRFAYKDNDIKYIHKVEYTEEDWTIPETFMYKQEESKPDFLLTGIWIEKDSLTSTNAVKTKINNMNIENNQYGLIANTICVNANNETKYNETIEKYVANIVEDDIISNMFNTNRTILKIINQDNVVPIKATGEYSKDKGLITIEITYSKFGIKEVIDETIEAENNKLTIISTTNGKITATSAGLGLEDGDNIISIIDNRGNTKKIKLTVLTNIYASLYKVDSSTYTLIFSQENKKGDNYLTYDITGAEYKYDSAVPWYSNINKIKTVEFESKVTPISTAYWFHNLKYLNDIKNIENLNTKQVKDMNNMFYNCSQLTNLDVSNFNTNNVTNMKSMFEGCRGLTELNVSNFNTNQVTNMSRMFLDCSGLTELNISKFNTDQVKDMNYMFDNCSQLTNLDVSNFNTNNVTDIKGMFIDCSGLTELNVSGFNTNKITNMSELFSGCSGLTELDVSNFNTNKVTNMSEMFRGCSELTRLNLSNFNTNNVTDVGGMFRDCSGLTELNVSNFDTSNVTNVGYMFENCSKLTELNVSNFNTIEVTNMVDMFYGCSNIAELDVSNFNTNKVTNIGCMFKGCSKLTELDISNFDTSNVTDMSRLFQDCSGLVRLNVNNLDTSNVKYTYNMFSNCSNLIELDISSFNTRKTVIMDSMFQNCSNLEKIYVGPDWVIAKNKTDMFKGCGAEIILKQ